MDHHHNMDHGGMDMPSDGPKCNMNMLFTWDTTNLCIVFSKWRISSTFSLILSLIGVVLLTAGYELFRDASRRVEARSSEALIRLPNDDASERDTSLRTGKKSPGDAEKRLKLLKAALYAIQVFYSFFIMLLFMTYNGWVMLAVAVGAFVGYLAFGDSKSTSTKPKGMACH